MKKRIETRPKKLSVQNSNVLYENDFVGWTKDQANLLKKKEFNKLDFVHLIEELISLGTSEERALESYLSVYFEHLLKQKFQPENDGGSWQGSIKVSKFRIERILKRNPSLKQDLEELIDAAYTVARIQAAEETKIDEKKFPKKCPWKEESIKLWIPKMTHKAKQK